MAKRNKGTYNSINIVKGQLRNILLKTNMQNYAMQSDNYKGLKGRNTPSVIERPSRIARLIHTVFTNGSGTGGLTLVSILILARVPVLV